MSLTHHDNAGIARVGWIECCETHQRVEDMMGFGYRLYPSDDGYNGAGGKGINKMIGQLIAIHAELPPLSIER